MSFLSELKRRNVVRMSVLYVVASWVVLQIADVIFDPLGVPAWVFRMLLSLLALGLPFALIFAWVFELTPEGLKRERDIDPGASIVHKTGNRMNVVIVILLVVAIGGLVINRLVPAPVTTVAKSAGSMDSAEQANGTEAPEASQGQIENSIAVLPFVNMSGDPDNEYFSDGLTEELLNSLVKLGGLQVTGRTSSFAFKGQNKDLREIGRLLDVANVLEGSVRKAGNRVRITVQLIKASDGYHLWSETFDRELDDIFAIQAEIAGQVSNALHLALLGPEVASPPVPSVPTESPEAYEEYLRGTYALQRDPDDQAALEKAGRHFERAIEIDPAYVDAYWGMFNVWDRFNRNGFVPYNASLEQMENYDRQIRAMAPGSDRALDTAARTANVHFDYPEAAEYLQEAVEHYPGNALLWSSYAQTLLLLNPPNRPDSSRQARSAAAQAIETSVQLDPLSPAILRTKANWLMQEGDCDELEALTQRALELDSEIGRFRAMLATCILFVRGDLQSALDIAGREPLGYARNTLQAVIYNKLGMQEQAQRHLDGLYLENGDSASYQYGQIFAQWGETDTALAWLENALLIHDPGIILSGLDRMLDPLRGDPRFEDILAAAGYR
jgi:TolB-like protein/tetratricopeptide (TPR) repeat protein